MTDEEDALEAAFVAFEAKGGAVDTESVVDASKALGDDAIQRLRASAREGSTAARARAAERLKQHFAQSTSAEILDRVVAGALEDAGAIGEALETRRRALLLAPSWHPGISADLLAGVARAFVELDQPEDAVPWIERAFGFDPFHLGALRTFVDALLKTDDDAHAFGVADHLVRCGAPLVASLVGRARPSIVPPFAPDLDRLRALSDDAWGKLVASFAFDPRPRPARSLRLHALGCAMRKSFEYAAMCANAALGAPADAGDARDARDARDAHDEHAAARALAMACSVRAKSLGFPVDPSLRMRALETADGAAMAVALHDPAPLVRLHAAGRIDHEAATAILRAQAELESARGVDLRPAHEIMGACATMRAKAMRARREVRVFPVEGAAHPVFQRLREGEAIVVWSIHPAPLPSNVERDLRRALGETTEITLRGETLELSTHDAADPRRFIEGAIAALRTHDAKTIVAGRFVRHAPSPVSDSDADADARAWRLVDDPPTKQAWYERLGDDGWRAAMEGKGKAPISDPREGWSAQLPTEAGLVAELRPLRMIFSDVRVVWGLPPVEHRDAPPIEIPATVKSILARAKAASERTPRGVAMAKSIEAALAKHVDGPPLSIVDHRSEPHAVDEIVKGDRRGFAFGVHGVTGAFVQHVPGAFWFREYELFLALREVIADEGLAPVVHWFRRDGLWVFNVWERD